MIKSVRVNKFAPSAKELVYQELADAIHQSVTIAEGFHKKYKRTDRQEELRRIIEESEIPDGEVLTILCYGSTGSGKSHGVQGECIDLLTRHPGLKALYSRRTYVEIEDTIWADTKDHLDNYDIPYRPRMKSHELFLGNGSFIRMRSAEKAAQSKNNKVHGLGSTAYRLAVLEEADEIPEEFLNTVYARMRLKVPGMRIGIIFLICNPPSKDHWIYERFFNDPDNLPDDPKSHKRVLKFHVRDNQENVAEGYQNMLMEAYKDDPLLMKAFLDGDFSPDLKGNPIFMEQFSEKLHVADNAIHKNWDPDLPIAVSIDFGFNTPAILVGQDYPSLNQLRVYKTWKGRKILLRPFLTKVMIQCNKMFPGARYSFFCDPHGNDKDLQGRTAETAVSILKDMGYPPRFTRMSTERGLDVLFKAMSTHSPSKYGPVPGLWIDPQCEDLITALSLGYCNKKDTPKGRLDPLKDGTHDHLVDVLRYWATHVRGRTGSGSTQHTEHTDLGRWNTVASGEPSTWSTQLAAAKETRYLVDSGNGRRTSSQRSRNHGRKKPRW